MKEKTLVVTIPCLNEAKTIAKVIRSIPKKIPGIGQIKIVVIDDGSTDNTQKAAKKAGANSIIVHQPNLGLAASFKHGVKKALSLGADIIVNTDGDNQYDQSQIPQLIKPILKGEADMVLGNRQVKKIKHMPLSKKIGNIFGSWVIRKLTGSTIQDASTGFRAFNRLLARSFELLANHTYTHETIIHTLYNGFRIKEIPINFKKRTFGQSRLIQGIWPHIKTSGAIIVRTILIYKAFKYLTLSGLGIMLLGVIGAGRFLWFYFNSQGSGHVQSLIFSSILISIGFSTMIMGFLADLINIQSKNLKNLLGNGKSK